MKKLLLILVSSTLIFSFAFITQKPDLNQKKFSVEKRYDGLDRNPNDPYVNTNPIVVDRQVIPEGERHDNGWTIGPEIPITGMTGYYDYQMNGSQSHHIWRNSSTVMYATMMVSSDSLNIAPSRRTQIAFSADDGATWTDMGAYPNFKSGFPCVHGKSNGTGMVGNHYSVNTPFPAGGYMNYDITAGGGSFNGVAVPPNFAWPEVTRMTNGNMLEVGDTYQSAATDSIAAAVFNSTTLTFGAYNRLVSPTGVSANSSIASNNGPNGKAIIVHNPYRETGGNWSLGRIWSVLSTDNGNTWGSFNLLFNPHVIGTDSISPNVNGSCDVIMDANGNYYWSFNSLGPTGLYANGRLLVGKNTNEPAVIAGTANSPINPIPQIPSGMVQQAFISSFDHSCFAISDDGLYIFISYSVPFANDTLNTFNKCHIFYQYAPLATMVWSAPQQVTLDGPTSFDERYASINRVAYNQGGYYTLYMIYQKDPQPGSCAYSDNAPISRNQIMFRKITDATLIGMKHGTENVGQFSLSQNYPNPFNPVTTINYNIPSKQFVTLKVYDVLGRLVTTLVNGEELAGSKTVTFDATNYASGIYFYTLTAGSYKDTKKLVLAK